MLALVCGVAACFDSDDKFRSDGTTGGTSTTTNASTSDTGSTSVLTTAGETGPDSCQDAIECIQQCTLSVIAQMVPEPDLGCFLTCTDTLQVEEALILLELSNCVSKDICVPLGCCEDPSDTTGQTSGGSGGSSTSDSSGGSSSSGSSSGDSSSTGDPLMCGPLAQLLMDPCLACIFDQMLMDAPPGCEQFAMDCDEQ